MTFRNKVIIIVVIIIIISLIIFSLIYYKNISQKAEFSNMIIEIDTLIDLNLVNKADELLFRACKFAVIPVQYKRLLKRALILKGSDNLENISLIAYKKYPEDELILSTYMYILLNTGKIDAASSILLSQEKKLLPESLIIETNIKTKNYHDSNNLLYQGITDKSISLYRKLYKLTNNNKFLLNAVLLSLENGEFESADTIFSEEVSCSSQYRNLQFLIKYDSGKYDKALEMLDIYDCGFSIRELLLLRIDIQIRQGFYKKAQTSIKEFLDIYPDYSWIPYYNYIWLNTVDAVYLDIAIVEKGIKIYPNNKKMMLMIMHYYEKHEMNEKAIDILEDYILMNKKDNELDIILKELKGTKDPKYMLNILRDFVNQNPENISASRYLAWNIFLNNDIQHLQEFLNQIEGAPGWIKFFQALISVYNGEITIAIEEFHSSYEVDPQWETLYNLAVISEYTNNYQNAIEYYQNAENSLANTKENKIIKSIIRTELAFLFYKIKDYDNTYREVRNALDLDIDNLKANLLLKKLESVTF